MTKLSILASPFPKLRQSLDLGEFHEDLAGNVVNVWLNVSDDFEARWAEYANSLDERNKQQREVQKSNPQVEINDELTPEHKQQRAELYAELWDVDVDEVEQLFSEPKATGLVNWMRNRTWGMITEHRQGQAAKVRSG